jgi:hypothetical protein
MLLTHALHPDPFEANGMPPTYLWLDALILQNLAPFQGDLVPWEARG